MIRIANDIETCDVLIIGGGIAGLMAAIAAAEKGVKVIVAEKADSKRSGSGATGTDHFGCYIPEYHKDLNEFMKRIAGSMTMKDADLVAKIIGRTYEVAQDWQSWGINMKPHGDWEFNGHALPGKMRTFLKYDGTNQKQVLTKVALEKGVQIDNHTPVTEFIVDEKGEIAGAVAVDISTEDAFIKVYKAKTIITATGIGMRLFPSITPGWIFNLSHCPAGTGGGRAAALHVGATLVNMDIVSTHAGPRIMERSGKATWIGVLTDTEGKPVGPFVTKPTKELGDITADIWQEVFVEKNKNGTGPVYMNCTDIEPEDMEYMRWGFVCEGDTSLLDAMDKQNIDLKRDMVEFGRYNPKMNGLGLLVDINHETTVKGLYCAGDEAGNAYGGISGAAVTGRSAGENAAEQSLDKEYADFDLNHPTIKKCQTFYSTLLERETGATWEELNYAIQQIMQDYAGTPSPRSETKMTAGLKYLMDLETSARNSIKVTNAHELMRALECFSLIEMGKCVFVSALARKETRGGHCRSDYTFTNPLNNGNLVTVRMEGECLRTDWYQKH